MEKRLKAMSPHKAEFIMEDFEMTKKKGKAHLLGQMENIMKECGKREKDMEWACGLLPKETTIWGSGKKELLKEMEYTKLIMDRSTKGVSRTFLSMVGVKKLFQIETNMKEITMKAYLMVQEYIYGQTVQLMKGIFVWVTDREKEFSQTPVDLTLEVNFSEKRQKVNVR